MKRLAWIGIGMMMLSIAVLWAVSQVEQAHIVDMPSVLPDGALMYLQARDFHSLLKDWNSSEQKRTWLKGDNYQAFSRSRLFARLSQAQDEFSTAAGLKTDSSLLDTVAGKQSSLGVFDIGNLEFIFITRMDQRDIEATPLWQLRAKFEQRTAGTAQFFIHNDSQSNRTAAFAAKDGWLILGTSERLVAGVLDRLQSPNAHSLSGEAWYADAVKQVPGPADDLRMVLNLEKIVPSPYFRSYWVQRNITEMKQYRSALSDLHRTADAYREERVLLRKASQPDASAVDVQPLAALAPEDAAFYAAHSSPDVNSVLASMRENLLELKPEQTVSRWIAPPPVPDENAGSASMLEERIDQAPVIVKQADAYLPLRAVLSAARPTALLETYSTGSPEDGVFSEINRGMVIAAAENWNEAAMRESMTAAVRPALTAAEIGVGWSKTSNPSGDYFSLDGQVSLYTAVREKLLFLATDATLLQHMLARQKDIGEAKQDGITYTAVFRHEPREQQSFRALVTRLDKAGRSGGTADAPADGSDGQTLPFFSGNIASLGRMFSSVSTETVEERDRGATVTQTVIYKWRRD